MRSGFIGAGSVSQTIARHLLQHGYTVVLSNSRGPDTLAELVTTLGEEASAEDLGFACVDLGTLAAGGQFQQVGGPPSALNHTMVKK